jgi:hypothetical protein
MGIVRAAWDRETPRRLYAVWTQVAWVSRNVKGEEVACVANGRF